jgi:hypothetical protein
VVAVTCKYVDLCELPDETVRLGVALDLMVVRGNQHGSAVYLTPRGETWLREWIAERMGRIA